jgi:hypothetical protein
MTKRKIEYWVIPPEQDAEFVACMEEVLETYAIAYDARHPVLCMDEQPIQLLKETRVLDLPPTPFPAAIAGKSRIPHVGSRQCFVLTGTLISLSPSAAANHTLLGQATRYPRPRRPPTAWAWS